MKDINFSIKKLYRSKEDISNYPYVSVIILNFNGEKYIRKCLSSVQGLNYPKDKYEIIFVDNGSTDGSIDYVSKKFRNIKIVRNEKNFGFSKGNNIGMENAEGELVAFLNNDMVVDKKWLLNLVKCYKETSENVCCISSKILSYDGKKIDFIDGQVSFYAHAYQISFGEKYDDLQLERKPIFFPCGGSFLINRDIYLAVGGFDDDYFAYFEDVDLGWRLWLLGYKVYFEPKSVVYHKHWGTTGSIPNYKRHVLYERNALYTIIKNYEKENLLKVLPAAILLSINRGLNYGGVDLDDFRFEVIPTGENKKNSDELKINKITLSPIMGINGVIENLYKLVSKREKIQKNRKLSDKELFKMFKMPFKSFYYSENYHVNFEKIIKVFELEDIFKI